MLLELNKSILRPRSGAADLVAGLDGGTSGSRNGPVWFGLLCVSSLSLDPSGFCPVVVGARTSGARPDTAQSEK